MIGNCCATFIKNDEGKYTYSNDTANIFVLVEAIRRKKNITKEYLQEMINYFYDYKDYYHVPNTLVKCDKFNELFDLDKMPLYLVDFGYYLKNDDDSKKLIDDIYKVIFDLKDEDLPNTYRYFDSIFACKLVNKLCKHCTIEEFKDLCEYFQDNYKDNFSHDLREACIVFLQTHTFKDCFDLATTYNNKYIMGLAITFAEYYYPYIENSFYCDFLPVFYHTQMLEKIHDQLCFRDDIFVDTSNVNKNSKFLLYIIGDKHYVIVPSDSLQGLSNDLAYYHFRVLFDVEFNDLLTDLYEDRTIEDYLQCLAQDVYYYNNPEMYDKLMDFSHNILDFLKCTDLDKFKYYLDKFKELLKLDGDYYKVYYFDNPYDLVKYYCEHDLNNEIYNSVTKLFEKKN